MEYEVVLSSEIFPGFYCSDYDPGNIEEDEEDVSEFNYEEYSNRICQGIVDIVSKYIDFKIIKWRLRSPREYNYRNDEIYVTIDTTPEEILYKFVTSDYANYDYVAFDDYADKDYHMALLETYIEMQVCEQIDIFEEMKDLIY